MEELPDSNASSLENISETAPEKQATEESAQANLPTEEQEQNIEDQALETLKELEIEKLWGYLKGLDHSKLEFLKKQLDEYFSENKKA